MFLHVPRSALLLTTGFAALWGFTLLHGLKAQPPGARQPAAQQPAAQQPASKKQAPKAADKATPATDTPVTPRDPDAKGQLKDAVGEAQQHRKVAAKRPEQETSEHDKPEKFKADGAPRSSKVLESQPDQGAVNGFEFYRDPLNAAEPKQTFEETMAADVKAKPGIMQKHRELLESRYNLEPKHDPKLKMTRGKPIAIGPTARLGQDVTWAQLADQSPADIKKAGSFPYPALPHPKHATGGQVFPQMQLEMFPRLTRFDVDFDIPEPFLPEFPPAFF